MSVDFTKKASKYKDTLDDKINKSEKKSKNICNYLK